MNNVLENPLIEFIYDKISSFNESLISCEFEDISMFVYHATDISDVKTCKRLALDALGILANAGLIFYDYGYKVIPAL